MTNETARHFNSVTARRSGREIRAAGSDGPATISATSFIPSEHTHCSAIGIVRPGIRHGPRAGDVLFCAAETGIQDIPLSRTATSPTREMAHSAEQAFRCPIPDYAVIFRTHFWDEYVQRQLDRLVSRVGRGHVYVLVDETNGAVSGIEHDRVVRLQEEDVLSMGLPRAGEGNLLWFNGDYPLYSFLRDHPAYDYYLQLEYDVVLNTGTDALVDRVAADGVDFLGLTKGEPVDEWAWLHTCRGVYEPEETVYKLVCFSVFSRRALQTLFDRRLELAGRLARSEIEAWPFCEGFIATEMAKAGYASVELTDYADTEAYDTWPPFVESDLPNMTERTVIHPVLDQQRYVASLLKYKVGLIGYVNVNSVLHRKLRRLPVGSYLSALTTSFTRKALRTARSHHLLPS